MATIYADATGNIVRALWTHEQEADYPEPPPGAVDKLTFDAATNAHVIQALDRDSNNHKLRNGVLTFRSATVDIQADGSGETERKAARAQVATLRDYLANTSPNGAATVAALKATIRVMLFIAQRLLGRELSE